MLKQDEQDVIWKHFQNQGSEVFDLSYSRLRYLAERCSAGMQVLNIGVGNGLLEKLLVSRGVTVYSLDPVNSSIEKLRAELDMGERAQQGYSTEIPFENSFFDKVIMTEVLEHIPPADLNATINEVKRVLKVDAEFTGTVPYQEDLNANFVFCPHCQSNFHRWGHHHYFDKASLSELLEEHGFDVKRLYPRTFPDFRRPGIKQFLRSVFRLVLGRMGEQLVGPHLYYVAKNVVQS